MTLMALGTFHIFTAASVFLHKELGCNQCEMNTCPQRSYKKNTASPLYNRANFLRQNLLYPGLASKVYHHTCSVPCWGSNPRLPHTRQVLYQLTNIHRLLCPANVLTQDNQFYRPSSAVWKEKAFRFWNEWRSKGPLYSFAWKSCLMKNRHQLELLDPPKVSQISISMNKQNHAYSTCMSTAKPILNSKAIGLS